MSRVLPILFNTDMVRAILDGKKTVTRRLIKSQPPYDVQCPLGYCTDGYKSEIGKFAFGSHENGGKMIFCKPPYQPGDILYVRETVWQKIGYYLDVDGETKPSWYKEFKYVATDEKPETGWNYSWAKRPSIHMPKEAARIWLKVKDVWVEQLQECGKDWCLDIEKEGVVTPQNPILYINDDEFHDALREEFQKLWNSTIKKSDLDIYGWDANPWVWVIEFERCERPEGAQLNDTGRNQIIV